MSEVPVRIDEARIPSPCDEDEASMRMDGIDRFCNRCEHTVYDLSARTEVEARRLLALPGKRCIQYRVRKATGELLFATGLLTAGLATGVPAYAAGSVPSLLAAEVTEISSEAVPGPTEPTDVDTTIPPCDPNGTDPAQDQVGQTPPNEEPVEATAVEDQEYHMMRGRRL